MKKRPHAAGARPGGIVACLTFLVGMVGASCDVPTAPRPSVRFEVDAPFCSGVQFRLRFSIDDAVVGEDTLMDGESSVAFATEPGPRDLHAEFLNVPTSRDTSVTLVPGERFSMLLDFYCS